MDENQNDYSYGNGSQDNGQNMYSNENQNGYHYDNQSSQQYPQEPSGNRGMSIASLVVGIFSILCCCCSWLGAVLGVVGILLAVFSKPKGGQFEGIAIGGLICSIIGVVLAVVVMVVQFFVQQSPEYVQFMDMYMQQLAPLLQDYNQ